MLQVYVLRPHTDRRVVLPTQITLCELTTEGVGLGKEIRLTYLVIVEQVPSAEILSVYTPAVLAVIVDKVDEKPEGPFH